VPIDPGAQLVQDRAGASIAAAASLLGVVAGESGVTLDREQARDDANALEGDAITGTRRGNESSASVRPAARSLAAFAFEESGDVGAARACRPSRIEDENGPSRGASSTSRTRCDPKRTVMMRLPSQAPGVLYGWSFVCAHRESSRVGAR
jgi:hypothetical protein